MKSDNNLRRPADFPVAFEGRGGNTLSIEIAWKAWLRTFKTPPQQ